MFVLMNEHCFMHVLLFFIGIQLSMNNYVLPDDKFTNIGSASATT